METQAEHVFASFNLSDDDAKALKTVLDKFDTHFTSRTNVTHERALFYARNQDSQYTANPPENLSDYYNKRHGVVSLPELKSGQRVFVPDRKESGVVIDANETPRLVVVQVGKRVIRRNRHDLCVPPTALNLPVYEEDFSESPVPATSSQSSVPCAVFSHTSEGVPDDVSPHAPRHVPPRSTPVVPQSVVSSPSVQAHQEPDPVASTPTASSGVHTKCGRFVRPH
ncbi:hypothetical protein CAPTEDRAFT_192194 [Capitella teleta]|uniref:Uncharacterized protein n=1 Tax=Capitella teleta TaxID=283909 RepID=R7TTY0_CAPTE|nr:hypothetical protein CAPTEDRAFT_192194 [Capitella teleta]|eukprot:ELT94916.1 hypothetical protein CAPTEDRAFT_192194 [Capitella teleta]